MEYRTCKKCGKTKPITEFYKHGDYYATQCKECARAYSREYQHEHREERMEYSKNYYHSHKEQSRTYHREWEEQNRERKNERARAWSHLHKDKLAEKQRKYRRDNPEKMRAQSLLNSYLQRGKIEKSTTCEICGKECKTEAHHSDYSKPLDVIWVCKKCHCILDNERGLAEEAS